MNGSFVLVPTFKSRVLNLAFASLVFLVGCQDRKTPRTTNKIKPDFSSISPESTTPTKSASSAPAIHLGTGTRIQRARTAANAGHFDEALELIQPILISHPDHADAVFVQAQCEAGSGQLSDAINTLHRIPLERSPVSLAAAGKSVELLIRLKQFGDAESKLREIIALVENHPLALRRLSQLLNNLGRRMEAAVPMRKLAQLGVATEAELFGMHTFTEPFIDKGNANSQPVPLSPLANARLLWFDGRFRQALEATEQLFQRHPDDSSIAAFHGRVLSEMQNNGIESWIASLPDKVIDQSEYWFAMGTWYQRNNEHDLAIRCFLEAVARDDTDRLSYLGLARSLELSGLAEESRQVRMRYEALEELWFVVTGYDRSEDNYRRIIERLIELRRFDEAQGWQKMANSTGFAISLTPKKGTTPILDQNWKLCGLDRDRWPLPKKSSKQTAGSNRSPSQPNDKQSTANNSIELVDVAATLGLNFRYRPAPEDQVEELLLHQTMSAGVAIIDYDQDGWPDVYLTQSGGLPNKSNGSLPNCLFRNQSGKRFAESAATAEVDDRSYGQGCTSGDLNQDGFPDLIVANHGENVVFINQGDGTFRSLRPSIMSNVSMWTSSIACADLDGDQLPDIVAVNYINDPKCYDALCSGKKTDTPLCSPQRFRKAKDRFLYNDGHGGLVEKPSGRDSEMEGYGLGLIVGNFDERAGNDVLIGNDTDANHYWQSRTASSDDQGYRLTECAQLLGCAYGLQGWANSCMGIASGDYDRNGHIDFHITNYSNQSSDLYLQTETGMFSNQFAAFELDRITTPMLAWGTQAADLDHDGWLDMVILNGNVYNHSVDGTPYRMLPQLLRGGPRSFELLDDPKSKYWHRPAIGRSLAKTDFNRDGKVDFVATHLDQPTALLQNNTPSKAWVGFELVGTRSERHAIGAKIQVTVREKQFTEFCTSGDGFCCSNDLGFVVGLGEVPDGQPIRVDVWWPSGLKQTFVDLKRNRSYRLIENQNAWREN